MRRVLIDALVCLAIVVAHTTLADFIAIAGIAGAVIVWYKIKDIGWVSYLIGAMSGILIITLSILMIEESGEEAGDIDDCELS